ncbi:MAG: hypothetical protein WC838_00820, partial [Candidatus Margulisiibacteriota bacterium]
MHKKIIAEKAIVARRTILTSVEVKQALDQSMLEIDRIARDYDLRLHSPAVLIRAILQNLDLDDEHLSAFITDQNHGLAHAIKVAETALALHTNAKQNPKEWNDTIFLAALIHDLHHPEIKGLSSEDHHQAGYTYAKLILPNLICRGDRKIIFTDILA